MTKKLFFQLTFRISQTFFSRLLDSLKFSWEEFFIVNLCGKDLEGPWCLIVDSFGVVESDAGRDNKCLVAAVVASMENENTGDT